MKNFFIIACTILALTLYGFSVQDIRLLRMPDINKDIIVFVYAGDIWSVSSASGEARRLTSHEGMEIFPKISPDGKMIAFSAEYSGTRQVYVIPVKGGTPRQLTYYNDAGTMPPRGGWDNVVLDWTPDSQKILIRANRTPHGRRRGKYFLVDINGGLEAPLQIPEAGFGTFSPDGNSIVYAPISREFRTWKRMKGGMAADIWTYDLKKNVSKRLTTFPGTDHIPIWYKNKIYFASDRTLTLNIYSYDLERKKIEKITNHSEYDVMWPSGHDGLVVYENGGFIYKLDLDSGKMEKITVNLNFDNPNLLPYHKNVKEFITRFGATISPEGKRAAFDARGDIFTVPAKKGVTVNLTRTQGIRETYPAWSPDGKWIAYISDKTGDYEIYLADQSGKKATVQLTKDHKVWKYAPAWSPDSKYLLFSDMHRKFQVIDIQTKKITVIDKGMFSDINDFDWSGDSKWVVYTKTMSNQLDAILVYSLEQKKSFRISSGRYEDFSPTFSKCGKYIFFISDRDFDMNFQTGFSSMEFDFVMNRTARIYALALIPDAPDLFKDENDLEEEVKAVDKGEEKKGEKDKEKKDPKKEFKPVVIDFKNISSRVSVFPLANDNYQMVKDIGGKVLYYKDQELRLFDMKTKKDELVIKGIDDLALSANNKKILYKANGKWGIIDIKPKQKAGTGNLNLEGLVMKIDPVKEWKQIYNDGWRIFRDWFYVYNMHGVDWQKMKVKYGKLLPYVSHRADLDYIFGELVGELNVGHTYVNWGDFKRVKRLKSGLLGADLKADQKAGRYKITKIYQGENWNERTRSPLTEQGINVKEGDYIISLNGCDVTTRDNPYSFLENTFGKKIPIIVNSKPTKEGARTYWIKPITGELGLFYMDWVNSRRKMVDKLSDGRIAYIHVPDTAIAGNREFFKGLYAYSDKDAFIIDERNNGGGWTPGKMIEKLSQRTLSYRYGRNLELSKMPGFALDGPKVMLINHYSASGGDAFPFWFRKRNLGVLIGTRTWGGLVGYGWSPQLIDGPSFAVPMGAFVGTDGEFIVEGVGVYPDKGFEVYDRPEAVAKGKDPCIETAVKYLLEQLKKNPPKKVKPPKEPDRSKWY